MKLTIMETIRKKGMVYEHVMCVAFAFFRLMLCTTDCGIYYLHVCIVCMFVHCTYSPWEWCMCINVAL